MDDFSKMKSLEELKEQVIALDNIPAHVAIIMDGNGRWAKTRNMPIREGHFEGIKAVKRTVKIAREMGVKVLTLYTFSVQNWKRSPSEIKALMSLLSESAFREVDELMQEGVKVVVSGDLTGLPFSQRKAMEMIIKRTSGGEIMTLNLALNYGGREEIVEAMRKIGHKIADNKIAPADIDEELIAQNLYTAGLPDPDLLIRTSGEMRVSNFLLWQTAYTEFYVTDTLWPDFDDAEFCKALLDYARRDRRFGGRRAD